jgi:hypothetical protein
MVNNYEQAERIQRKRRDAAKPGVAKAVKRFVKRNPGQNDCGLRAFGH